VVLRAAVHHADGRVIVTGPPGTTALTAHGWVAVGGPGVVWTPPVDVTITVCPARTSAEFTAEPQPVPTPQPSSAVRPQAGRKDSNT
jgi:hypothetical protein